MPKITVLIPVYNRAHYISDAIESILAQNLTDFELLIIDDGSTDCTSQKVRSHNDSRIRLLHNNKNMGIPATRNLGIDAARGKYLAFLDSDDRAFPERLARQATFLDHHVDYAAVGAWIEWMDASGNPTGKVKRKSVKAEQISAERLFRCGLENTSAMARTSILRAYRHREEFALGEDFDLWARISADYHIATLPQVLVYKRQHQGRTTEGQNQLIKSLRLAIFAWQLQALGVPFTSDDLERHNMLRRMHKIAFIPDSEFLDWAESWLCLLLESNRKARLYPEPAFSGLLGGFWLKVCWQSRSNANCQSLRRFWTSPLRCLVWSGMLHEAYPWFIAALPMQVRK